jgi:hypothetical protein
MRHDIRNPRRVNQYGDLPTTSERLELIEKIDAEIAAYRSALGGLRQLRTIAVHGLWPLPHVSALIHVSTGAVQ